MNENIIAKKPEEDNKGQRLDLTNENKRRSSTINYSKLKFNKNILIQILKKTTLRKILDKKNKTKIYKTSKVNDFNINDKPVNYKTDNLFRKFQNMPEMKKYHNITAEKINDLINSTDEIEQSSKVSKKKYKINNLKLTIKTNEKEDEALKIKLNLIKNTERKKSFNNFLHNEQNKENNKHPKYKNNIKYININDLNLNKENLLAYLSSRLNDHNRTHKYNSLSKLKKNKMTNKDSTNQKKIFMSKTTKNYATNQWLESLKQSIKKYDVLHRRSRIDRLIFSLENPGDCFEENIFEERPGDKYILLKNQMVRYKDKFENIIRDIKLNQKRSEYLMKKYIFDLLSRKKDVY
jgi:hypothetical protein